MMDTKYEEAIRLFDQNDLKQSLEVLTAILVENPHDVASLNLRGRIHYKMQNWGSAMNDFAVVLESEPENPEAKTGLEMARSILNYFTPDMFNP